LAGITPKSVARYFEKDGYRVTMTDDLTQIDELSKIADGCILYYRWKSKALIPPYYAHFVSYHREGDGYFAYNVGNQSPTFTQPSAFLEQNGYYAIGIFIFDER